MKYSPTSLARLVDDCTVAIIGQNIRGGSGFFISQSTIISCAHVVARKDGNSVADSVQIKWHGFSCTATVTAYPPQPGGPIWDYPDLALITLVGTLPTHPAVRVGEGVPDDQSRLYATGYKRIY